MKPPVSLAFCVLLGLAVGAAAYFTPRPDTEASLFPQVEADWQPLDYSAGQLAYDGLLRDADERKREIMAARVQAAAFRNSLQWWADVRYAEWQQREHEAIIYAAELEAAQAAAAQVFSATSGSAGEIIYSGGGYCSSSYLSQWWGGLASAAASVCMCESGGNPNAVGGGGAYHGLFQFLISTFNSVGGGNVYDPADNASAAARLQARSGWGQWPACAARAGLL